MKKVSEVVPVWKKVEIGGMTSDQLLGQMSHADINVGSWARGIMQSESFVISGKRTVRLVRCKVHELGFTKEPTRAELWSKIQEIGELCPAEVGPHLRLQFKEQSNGDHFFVAMEPIIGSFNDPSIFYLSSNNGNGRKKLWLESCCTSPDASWSLKNEVVFISK